MKIRATTSKAKERGSAVLVVVVILFCIAAIVVENTRTLYLLQQELKLIDLQQQKQYGQGANH